MRLAALAFAALSLLLIAPASVVADGAWLDDDPPIQWNEPRMEIPEAPPLDTSTNPRCVDGARPPDTDEDEELVKAGWLLVGAYVGGWDMLVIRAASGFDGMCRPLGYNSFVFVNGIFAGSVSPTLMDSRTDGSASTVSINFAGAFDVLFSRYAETDPLCCPSRTSLAHYEIDPRSGAPVVILVSVFTQSTSE
jgi:hypothetical protein